MEGVGAVGVDEVELHFVVDDLECLTRSHVE